MKNCCYVASGAGALGIKEAQVTDDLLDLGWDFECAAGASAGAINAGGVAFGIRNLTKVWVDFISSGTLEDWVFPGPGPTKVLGLLRPRFGLIKGEAIRAALSEVLGANTRMGDSPRHLRIVVSNMSRRRAQEVDSRKEEHKSIKVVDALVCSLAVPLLVRQQQLSPKSPVLYSDGGIPRNVPRAIWDDYPELPTFTISFANRESAVKVDTLRETIAAILDLVRDAANAEQSKKPPEKLLEIALSSNGNALDFSQSKAECERLAKSANDELQGWLKAR